jgi:hypothetical protein
MMVLAAVVDGLLADFSFLEAVYYSSLAMEF